MSAPAPRAREAFADELRVSVPALVVAFLVAFLLRYTGLSTGLRVGASFFAYVMVQPFFRQMITGQRIGGRGWAFTTILATISGLAMWYIGDY